jgi:tetratricopeptide (TPR) repeat protein
MQRHYLSLVFTIMVVSLLVAGPAHAQSAEDWYNKGCGFAIKGDYSTAINCYKKTITLDPKFMKAYHDQALCSVGLGLYDEAIAVTTTGLGIDSNNEGLYALRARAFCEKGGYDRAIKDATTAIDLNGADPLPFDVRGKAYYNQGRYEQAREDYTAAILNNDGIALFYYERGLANHALGSYNQAVIDFTSAINLKGDNAVYYNSRGESYLMLKQYDKAKTDVENAINMDKNSYAFAFTYGKVTEATGDRDTAKAAYTYACKGGVKDACEALKNLTGKK